MATVNKDFRVKNGLVVEGTTGTINGSNILTEASTAFLSEYVADTVGAMITDNTESGISVTYDDADNTLDFNVNDFTITLGGDLSGSVTITDLASATLTASVAANSVALGTDTTGNYVASVSGTDGVSISGTGEGASVTIANSDKGSAQNIFKNIAVSGQSTIVADSNDDTLTLAGSGITITTDAGTDTVTLTNAGVTSISGTSNEIEVSAASGAVTIGLPNDVTIGNNLVVTGDLTVNGTTTTLNTETLAVEDNIILLNKNVTGTPTADAGLEVERGTSTNASLYWNETEDKWYVNNGSTAAPIALVGDATFNTFSTFSDGTNNATPDSTSDTFTFAAGTGIGVSVNETTDTLTISNSGVTSITGTADQVTASASTGGVTLSLPQSIATTSSPQFAAVTLTGALTATAVTLGDTAIGNSATTTAGTTATVIDSWSASTYRAAKYVISAKDVSGNVEAIEMLVTVDGSNNVYVTEYADVQSNGEIIVTDADYSTGNVRLLVTADAASTSVKVHKILFEA